MHAGTVSQLITEHRKCLAQRKGAPNHHPRMISTRKEKVDMCVYGQEQLRHVWLQLRGIVTEASCKEKRIHRGSTHQETYGHGSQALHAQPALLWLLLPHAQRSRVPMPAQFKYHRAPLQQETYGHGM